MFSSLRLKDFKTFKFICLIIPFYHLFFLSKYFKEKSIFMVLYLMEPACSAGLCQRQHTYLDNNVSDKYLDIWIQTVCYCLCKDAADSLDRGIIFVDQNIHW